MPKLFMMDKHQFHNLLHGDSSVYKKAAYNNICNRAQGYANFLAGKESRKHQSFANREDMHKFHDTENHYDLKKSGTNALTSADGTTFLTDKDAILEKWTEYFNSVPNRPSCIIDDAIDRLPQIESNILLNEYQAVLETRIAVQQL